MGDSGVNLRTVSVCLACFGGTYIIYSYFNHKHVTLNAKNVSILKSYPSYKDDVYDFIANERNRRAMPPLFLSPGPLKLYVITDFELMKQLYRRRFLGRTHFCTTNLIW